MMQRWSKLKTRPLRTFLRRGALFVLAPLMALTVAVSPLATQPANAQSLLSGQLLGGSFTNGLSSCAIETVGWVICPTMRSIAKLADYGFTYINQSFLRLDYSLFSSSSGTSNAWEVMRSIANGLFVVAFMALIYSQLTGRASGGYNIKRLLPRLIITAILVNISYFLCVILVDFSNITGDSILNVLVGIANKVGKSVMPIGKPASAFQDGTLSVITAQIMSKTGYAWVLLAPTAAVTISIATICAAGIVLLILRKVIVAMLILAAPVLFVAYLLPNTERFFYQGLRLFVQLLLLYPIVALLLGTGQIVSATIVSVGTGDKASSYKVTGDGYLSMNGGSSGSAVRDLSAAAAAVMPLLGVWFLFKGMNSIMSTAGSRLSASVNGRRGGGKNDEKARVTGKASSGVVGIKNALGIGNGLPGRRQAFSRNRRRRSLGGSALTGPEKNEQTPRAGMANRRPVGDNAPLQNAVSGGQDNQAKQAGDLQDAHLNGGNAEDMNVESAMAAALSAEQGDNGKEPEKHKTAKDIFNNLNRTHESKDKDRKFNSGPAPAGGSGGEAGGVSQPVAPSTSYRAPSMAQDGNIVSGGAAPQQPRQIIAVPVQIDASSLLGQQNASQTPTADMDHAPVSANEEKAKARAQQYLYDADNELQKAQNEIDILGKKDEPTEPPHVKIEYDEKDKT